MNEERIREIVREELQRMKEEAVEKMTAGKRSDNKILNDYFADGCSLKKS